MLLINFTWASKTALGPPALGQFWSPSAGIFSRVPWKKAEFWPIINWFYHFYYS